MKKIFGILMLILIFYICLNNAQAIDERIYLSDIESTASSSYVLKKDVDDKGNKFTLLKEEQEVVYDKGILVIPNANSYSSIYFNDIQEKGYKYFETDIGINGTVRNYDASVEFKIYADGKIVYSSGIITNKSEAEHIKISLENVKVLQLVVDSLGANSYDYAVWANSFFTGCKDTPYLAVDDLEFNLKEQITSSNILEYVIAKDSNGNDISNKVTYKTNYNGEEKGNFEVTYTVKDDNNNVHSRTVNMLLTGENYAQELSLERLKKPWASYLYHGRGTLSTQGKKAWDIVLKELLDFDKSKWQLINKWGEDVYLIDIDLQANGIYTNVEELSSLGNMLMDDEPRTFILKDWNCEITKKDGLASHIKLWVNKQSLKQDEWLMKIEKNTIEMLNVMKSDMTETQRLNVVANKYKNWIKYGGDGQLLIDGLGNGLAVCGGNARGYIYLSERLGIKSVWGRSGSHAWSFTKISDYDYWFKTDLLSGEFLDPGINGEGNLTVGGNYKTRHYKWFTFGTLEYPRKLLRYPSVWVELEKTNLILIKNQSYNLMDYISDYGSIFNDNYDKNNIKIQINKLNENGNITKENISSFEIKGDGTNLKAGYYQIKYIISDNGKTNYNIMNVRVSDGTEELIDISDVISQGNVGTGNLGLWTGTEEKWYTNGIYINESGSVSFDAQGYKYLTFDYGIKNSVRDNVEWGSNGKVAYKVVITTSSDDVIYEGSILGWKTKYESVFIKLPDDVKKITIYSLPKGSGNNHAGIGNLKLIKDNGTIENVKEENPPKLSKNEITITSDKKIDFIKEFQGIDDEDGKFKLNNDNFKIEQLPMKNDRYIPGIYKLKYELKDSDGNVTTGTIKVTIDGVFYTVTFYYNDMVRKIKVKENELIKAPSVTNDGYRLIGWYNKDEEFDFNTPITQDITLIARFKKIEIDINNTLNSNQEIENDLNDENNLDNIKDLNDDIPNFDKNQTNVNSSDKSLWANIYFYLIIVCLSIIGIVLYKKKTSDN